MVNTGFVTTGMNSTGPSFFVNGHPFRFVGFNDFGLAIDGLSYSQMYTDLSAMASYGATVVRCTVHGESTTTVPNHSLFQYGAQGQFWNESTFVTLDNAISIANIVGIRLSLITSNQWTDFGGKVVYAQWYNNINSTNLTADNFHDTPGIFTIYTTRLSKLMNRVNTVTGIPYNQDPTIMSWECINEGRYDLGADVHQNTLSSSRLVTMTGWYTSASSAIKTFAPNQLTGTGSISQAYDNIPGDPVHNGTFYGLDFFNQHAISTFDYCDFHFYPANGFVTQGTDCTCTWTTTYGYESQIAQYSYWAQVLQKPLVVGEVGIDKRNTVTGPQVDFYPRDVYFGNFFQDIFPQAYGGCLLWNLETASHPNNSYGITPGLTYTDPSVPVGNQTDTKLLNTILNTNRTLQGKDNPSIPKPCL